MNKELDLSELDFLLRFPAQPNVASPVDFLSNYSWGGVKVTIYIPLTTNLFVLGKMQSLTMVLLGIVPNVGFVWLFFYCCNVCWNVVKRNCFWSLDIHTSVYTSYFMNFSNSEYKQLDQALSVLCLGTCTSRRIPQSWPRHWRISKTMEEVRRKWKSRKGEVSPRVEEQDSIAKAVHDASP